MSSTAVRLSVAEVEEVDRALSTLPVSIRQKLATVVETALEQASSPFTLQEQLQDLWDLYELLAGDGI